MLHLLLVSEEGDHVNFQVSMLLIQLIQILFSLSHKDDGLLVGRAPVDLWLREHFDDGLHSSRHAEVLRELEHVELEREPGDFDILLRV